MQGNLHVINEKKNLFNAVLYPTENNIGDFLKKLTFPIDVIFVGTY